MQSPPPQIAHGYTSVYICLDHLEFRVQQFGCLNEERSKIQGYKTEYSKYYILNDKKKFAYPLLSTSNVVFNLYNDFTAFTLRI